MAESLTYRCDMRTTHRHSAEMRDKFHCNQRAEFIVSPGSSKATRDNSKLTCVQHTAKAVRWVLQDSGGKQVTVTALSKGDQR